MPGSSRAESVGNSRDRLASRTVCTARTSSPPSVATNSYWATESRGPAGTGIQARKAPFGCTTTGWPLIVSLALP